MFEPTLGKHSKQKSTELWFLTKQGGGGPDQTPQNQTHIYKCLTYALHTLVFYCSQPGVKKLFHPANNSSYEVCSCYILYLRYVKKSDSGPKFVQGGLESLVTKTKFSTFLFWMLPLLYPGIIISPTASFLLNI